MKTVLQDSKGSITSGEYLEEGSNQSNSGTAPKCIYNTITHSNAAKICASKAGNAV